MENVWGSVHRNGRIPNEWNPQPTKEPSEWNDKCGEGGNGDDEAEKDELPWRRFRVRNEKITRSALAWNRLCRKFLLLLINDRVERLSFDRISDIGA